MQVVVRPGRKSSFMLLIIVTEESFVARLNLEDNWRRTRKPKWALQQPTCSVEARGSRASYCESPFFCQKGDEDGRKRTYRLYACIDTPVQ